MPSDENAWQSPTRGSARVWAALIVVAAFTGCAPAASAPGAAGEASARAEQVSPAAALDVRYVIVPETGEYTAPEGLVERRASRGQRFEITAEAGDWVRVTALDDRPLWVRAAHLSRLRPTEARAATSAAALQEPSVRDIAALGQYGMNEADVAALRAGAAALFASGECRTLRGGYKAIQFPGVYSIDCGEQRERFFRMREGLPEFCGGSASEC